MNNDTQLLTRKEAASFLKIGLSLFDKMEIPGIKIGRRVVFRKSALESWLAERETLHCGRRKKEGGGHHAE